MKKPNRNKLGINYNWYTATVLWYFEALLIGINSPQFEGRFKHFLLVIRIIRTSRSFLQK